MYKLLSLNLVTCQR